MGTISWAMTIISWQENMQRAEVPPRWMWALDDELVKHFERIRDRSGDDDDTEDRPAAPMLVNEHARNRGRNLEVSHGRTG
jgi:hypothetical protein